MTRNTKNQHEGARSDMDGVRSEGDTGSAPNAFASRCMADLPSEEGEMLVRRASRSEKPKVRKGATLKNISGAALNRQRGSLLGGGPLGCGYNSPGLFLYTSPS